jgi:HPt (histidine-containing phosphotransfer) domain-containing protein
VKNAQEQGIMAKAKSEAPAVRTYADHEVILPPHKLKKAVAKPSANMTADDPVARAEAALAEIASEFSSWMDAECERLDQARRNFASIGINATTRDELFRAAHDIKGEAETFGFPLAGRVADSLCRLIEHSPELERVPMSLIEQHVDAVRAIIREATLPDAESTATKLAARLRQVTDEFLAHENRHRPDYLDGILGPPLAPDDPI